MVVTIDTSLSANRRVQCVLVYGCVVIPTDGRVCRRSYRKRHVSSKRKLVLPGGTEDANFDVMPRELGFMLRQTLDSEITRPVNYEKDREIRIFTSANALPVLGVDDSYKNDELFTLSQQRLWRAHIRDQLVFVGVPLTKVLAGNDNQTDAVSVQVSGSTTIFNTGIFEIQAFDLVVWDVPSATTEETDGRKAVTPVGLPTSKMCFHTVPLRLAARDDAAELPAGRSIAHCTTEDVLRTLFNDKSSVGSISKFKKRKRGAEPSMWDKVCDRLFDAKKPTTMDEKLDLLRPVLAYYTNAHQRYLHRVIGVALSKARPGGALTRPCFDARSLP